MTARVRASLFFSWFYFQFTEQLRGRQTLKVASNLRSLRFCCLAVPQRALPASIFRALFCTCKGRASVFEVCCLTYSYQPDQSDHIWKLPLPADCGLRNRLLWESKRLAALCGWHNRLQWECYVWILLVNVFKTSQAAVSQCCYFWKSSTLWPAHFLRGLRVTELHLQVWLQEVVQVQWDWSWEWVITCLLFSNIASIEKSLQHGSSLCPEFLFSPMRISKWKEHVAPPYTDWNCTTSSSETEPDEVSRIRMSL